jgi:hypothetical protein
MDRTVSFRERGLTISLISDDADDVDGGGYNGIVTY